jgi:hypothetical protein
MAHEAESLRGKKDHVSFQRRRDCLLILEDHGLSVAQLLPRFQMDHHDCGGTPQFAG